jgi:uncharacterized membrane protein YphA (DoxX/SURF4 family)
MNRAVAAWERFWFEPQPTSTLGLVRIAFGIVAVFWTLSLAGQLDSFFGPEGLLTDGPALTPANWGVFQIADPRWLVTVVWGLMLIGAIALLVGFKSRLAAFVVLIGVISFERRNPYVFNAGDALLRIIAFYLVLAPSGESLSVDRLRRARRSGAEGFWEFPARAPWALRLIQIQLSIIYLSSVWEKLQGDTWLGGTALSTALRLEDIQRFPVPAFMSETPIVVTALTWGTLVAETACGTLIWVPRLRPWLMATGVMLHVGIGWSLRVGYFSAAMLVFYVAFIPPRHAAAVALAVRDRLRHMSARRQKKPRREPASV